MKAELERIISDAGPYIVAFCCEHSAYRAVDSAGRQRMAYPAVVDVLAVPCSGRVSVELILGALEQGASKVMVMGCNRGSCHHLHGSQRAEERVKWVKQRLEEVGFDPERVRFCTLGPDSATDFVRAAKEIAEGL